MSTPIEFYVSSFSLTQHLQYRETRPFNARTHAQEKRRTVLSLLNKGSWGQNAPEKMFAQVKSPKDYKLKLHGKEVTILSNQGVKITQPSPKGSRSSIKELLIPKDFHLGSKVTM